MHDEIRKRQLFRKKPVVIEAVRYDGDTTRLPANFLADVNRSTVGGSCFISTLEGEMECHVGDWLIEGVKGEHYPCRADIFEATYEPAES